jgi:uncharacterized membrane protein YfcA
MFDSLPDPASLAVVLAGAFVAGFTTGFAGFGTGLVASGLWLHALPAPMVPPLVALASVAAHIVGLAAVRKAFAWKRTRPFLIGATIGVPLGVLALGFATPEALRLSIGSFLVVYAAFQLLGRARIAIGTWGGEKGDAAVGVGGGFPGGFAGLSGPLPLVWLQMRGGPSAQQRAIYQPFNLVVLTLASAGMAASGAIDRDVLAVAALCLPVTVVGAAIGARLYTGVGEDTFRRVVLLLLLVSGSILVAQAAI